MVLGSGRRGLFNGIDASARVYNAEAFMDTPIVNGTAYPYIDVQPQAYRLRILNACNDRMLNLQFYQAATGIVSAITVINGGSGYTDAPGVTITDPSGVGQGATASAVVDLTTGSPTYGQVTAIAMDIVGNGYSTPPIVTMPLRWLAYKLSLGDRVHGPNGSRDGSGNPESGDPFSSSVENENPGMIPDILDQRPGGVPHPNLRGPAIDPDCH